MNEDERLALNVANNNCDESLKVLIDKHSALCYNICNKYSATLNSRGVSFADILKEREYIIYKAALSFKPDRKAKFSTWLGNFARYHCLNLINEKKNHFCVEDKELHYHIDKESLSAVETENPKELRDFALNILKQLKDKRIIKVFELRYFSNEGKVTWSKISKQMNISIQTAINLHERGRLILSKKIKSKNSEDLI